MKVAGKRRWQVADELISRLMQHEAGCNDPVIANESVIAQQIKRYSGDNRLTSLESSYRQ